MKYIDLRSDTVTQPTDKMRQAMAAAVCGDDVYGDDPTVIELERLAADMLGKEAALFMPSGTMANQIAIMTLTKRGDEIILGKHSHIAAYEAGAAAVLSSVNYAFAGDNVLDAADIAARVRGRDVHFPDTGLVCLENALGNGRVIALADMKAMYDEAKKFGLPVYLDGARIFNAAAHLGVEAREIAQYSDALMFCISKGLCAPAGSLLLGDAEFIARARRFRKMLGGGMRQIGVLAAAGMISLNVMTKRLHEDHANADYLARGLNKISGVDVDMTRRDINLVFFTSEKAIDTTKLAQNGIKASGPVGDTYRFALHNGISPADIDKVLTLLEECCIIME